jgi:hypothetical protein
MDYRSLVEHLVSGRVLKSSLVVLPSDRASADELIAVQRQLGSPIDRGLLDFYSAWNGADLDVIRVYGANKLRKDQFGLVFGSDPSGFVYRFNDLGKVTQQDTDGGDIRVVAENFDDFIFGFVFGPRAAEFAGAKWLRDLHDAGIAT